VKKKGGKLLLILLLCFALSPFVDATKAVPARDSEKEKKVPVRMTDRPKSIVGVQIPLIESKNFKEFDKEISFLKKRGFNTIIVRVFQNNGDRTHRLVKSRRRTGVYFKTSHAPVIEDILGDVIDIARRNSMVVYAWMSTRSCDWFLSENREFRDLIYDFQSKKIRPVNRLNLFRKEAREYLKGLYTDLAKYDIDGILLQDDLILRHNESFSPEAEHYFSRRSGFKPTPDTLYKKVGRDESGKITGYGYSKKFWEWTEGKSLFLQDVFRELILNTKKTNPELKFLVNLHYETLSSPQNGKAWFSEDLDRLKKLDIDTFAVMSYHRQIKKELGLSRSEVMTFLASLAEKGIDGTKNPERILFKIQVFDWNSSEAVPDSELKEIIGILRSSGSSHLLFYPATGKNSRETFRKMLF
jgi:biofilm PGA synthesis lipoprotein PgaB